MYLPILMILRPQKELNSTVLAFCETTTSLNIEFNVVLMHPLLVLMPYQES